MLLELGGNNAAVVTPSADLDLAVRAIVFAAAGTAGQRCTTLRRLIVHRSVADDVVARMAAAYRHLPIGDPSAAGTLVGPLIHETAYRDMVGALEQARADGGEVTGGERRREDHPSAYYVAPAVVRMPAQTAIVATETFAPILYVLIYDDLDEAIALNNAVPQGLSSAIFTTDMREAERFLAGPTAASPTSTSARRAPRSAARSAARSKPAAAGSPVRTRGRPTCGGLPTPSIIPANYRWPKACSLAEPWTHTCQVSRRRHAWALRTARCSEA